MQIEAARAVDFVTDYITFNFAQECCLAAEKLVHVREYKINHLDNILCIVRRCNTLNIASGICWHLCSNCIEMSTWEKHCINNSSIIDNLVFANNYLTEILLDFLFPHSERSKREVGDF